MTQLLLAEACADIQQQSNSTKSIAMDHVVPLDASLNMSLSAFSTMSGGKEDLSLSRVPSAVEEVDMEEYTDEAHEYDMVDDEAHRGEDIQDVEVQDAQPTIDVATPVASHPLPLVFTASNQSSSSIHEVTSLIAPDPPHGLSDESHDTLRPVLDSSSVHESPSPFIIQDHPVTSEIVDSSAPNELALGLHSGEESAPAAVVGTQEPVELEHHDAHASTEVPENPATHAEATRLENDQTDYVEPEVPLETSVSLVAALSAGQSASEEASTLSTPAEAATQAVQLHTESHNDGHSEEKREGSNPHEISEGVYIEPPPAVLVEIPSSGRKFSIFNRPSRSGHSTPHIEEGTYDNVPVLLQESPTLFYEPISSIFDALRQVEVFEGLVDISDVELMFEVPCLKLFVSEV